MRVYVYEHMQNNEKKAPRVVMGIAAALLLGARLPDGLGAQESPARTGAQAVAQTGVPDSSALLTLADALRDAARHGFSNRIASGTSTADRARARLPLKGILPSARVESGVVRTTDPIGAFGTTLRQRLVTQAAFDPARLNNPAAITNVQGGLVLEVPLVNADAWAGMRAARATADASDASATWTARTTSATVIRTFYGAVLAAEKVRTLLQAQRALDAAARQVQAMLQQGLVTRADLLQANVRATDVASQLVAARNDVRTAEQQVALIMGRTDVAPLRLPSELPDSATVRALAVRDTLVAAAPGGADERPDVRAARATVIAANADHRRATATLLPRINSFARYDWNSPTALYGGKPNWTVGVMASWSPFSGGSEMADIAVATARRATALAGADATRAQARLDADVARRDVIVALERLDLAGHAAEQSREAHRLVEKRYAGGLVTVAELLGAEATATGAALAHAAARYALIEALAAHRLANGTNPSDLATALEGTH